MISIIQKEIPHFFWNSFLSLHLFFSIRFLFQRHWRLTGQWGKGGDYFFIPLYHFHPLTNNQTFICNFGFQMTITYFISRHLYLPGCHSTRFTTLSYTFLCISLGSGKIPVRNLQPIQKLSPGLRCLYCQFQITIITSFCQHCDICLCINIVSLRNYSSYWSQFNETTFSITISTTELNENLFNVLVKVTVKVINIYSWWIIFIRPSFIIKKFSW